MKKYVIFSILLFVIIGVTIYLTVSSNQEVVYSQVKFFRNTQSAEKIVLDNVEKNKTIKINGEEINLEYENTINNLNIYNNNNDDYIFKDNKLVGYLKESTLINNKIDKEAAKTKAIEFAKENINNFDRYELVSSNYKESYNEHSFRFVRKINGIDTLDDVDINVDGNGEIISFSASHQGEFEKYKKLKIDSEIINNMCLEAVQNKYGEKIKDINIDSQYLKILAEKLVVQTDVTITLKNEGSTTLTEIPAWESLICEIN